MANNVYFPVLDPNDVNINTNIVNGIPQYQDMYIFAELTAKSRGRTVIVTTNDGNVSQGMFKTGLEKPRNVNFMGVNQNKDNNNPNYLNFTTNYYDGSTGNQTQYESFGITSIKITTNSSYIPQVNIQFLDIRGLSFFNQKTSPYRILFDFPPPIFELSVKGYYGKMLQYKLHLVKYTSEFQAETGNFVIDANFVAVMYAPLSDILFRYIVNTPLITYTASTTPTPNVRPANTFELVLKLKNLYSAVEEKVKSDAETKQYDTTLKSIGDVNNATSFLDNYKTVDTGLTTANLITRTLTRNEYVSNTGNAIITNTVNQLAGLFEYDDIIKNLSTSGIPTADEISNKLYLVCSTNVLYPDYKIDSSFSGKTVNALINYSSKLIDKTKDIVGDMKPILSSDIPKPETFFADYDIKTQKNIKTAYIGIDLTTFYMKLYKQKYELKKTKTDLSVNIATKINNMMLERLGMKPTLYNIFSIICNDIDDFFTKLNFVSYEAESNHHIKYRNTILGNGYKDFQDTIYAFPLFVDQKKIVCGGTKEERIAPIELSQRLEPDPFPEIKFVNDFIQTFFTQKNKSMQYNMRTEQNDDGTSKWLPISPFDSTLGTTDSTSPYYNVIPANNKISTLPDNTLKNIFDIVLKRYYILSQSTSPNTFFGTQNKENTAYINLYASSEAVNLATVITGSELLNNNVKTFADNLKDKNINEFYTYIEKNNPDLYNFNQNDITYFTITVGNNAYVNKNNQDYEGVVVYDGEIKKQVIDKGSDKPIDKFKKDASAGFFEKIFSGKLPTEFYDFTMENVQYIVDNSDKEVTADAGVVNETRFISTLHPFAFLYGGTSGQLPSQKNALAYGNSSFGTYYKRDATSLKTFQNIVDMWVKQLDDHDTEIYSQIIAAPSKLSALMFLSNFGYTLSCFNKYPTDLNDLIFSIPAAIQVPKFLSAYIGAIVDAIDNGWSNQIINFFSGGTGENFTNKGLLIFADLHDVDKYLSYKDKIMFKQKFNEYYGNGTANSPYGLQLASIKNTYDAVHINNKKYKDLLNPSSENSNYNGVILPLIERTALIVFSQNTFKEEDLNTYPTGYTSIKTLNAATKHPVLKNANDTYFKTFLSQLSSQLQAKQTEVKKQQEDEDKKKNDKDIITQTYYSIKNINDKWLSNPTGNNHGYPFNPNGKRLIDSFAFVDRAMNPVGDTIINAETLIDLFDDPDVSIYTVMSRLLSLNGYEFFPLQNFMTHDYDSWDNSFRIDTSGKVDQQPAFVCMYIGGSSSYPTDAKNGFVDDGITDLQNFNGGDFATTEADCNPVLEDDAQTKGNTTFPYRKVRAFKVRFGEQNQSMFTGIKIDSKEYPDTNESIQILSRLAGDNKNDAPIPKGQNLYNLYENRAYNSTITALGNVMIQPTQYFQLENVPLFSGVYIILSVEHEITANKMITSFSGTKIMQYPVPRVTSPIAFVGWDGGDSENTSPSSQSGGQLTQAAEAILTSKNRLDQLNSVYGIDVSYAQKGFNWSNAVNSPNADDPKIKFAFIKATQGTKLIDSQVKIHANGAKSQGLKIGFYHYAQQYSGDDPVTDAKAQAAHFINTVNTVPQKPDFPLIVDLEDYDGKNETRRWSKIKKNNDLWIDTFIKELKNANYNTILYGGKSWFETNTSNTFGSHPLWHAQYPKMPEVTNPTIANGWNDWSIWQFSSSGRPYGYSNDVDINMMRKDFFDKHSA